MGAPDANGWVKGMEGAPEDELILIGFVDEAGDFEVDIAECVNGHWVSDIDNPTHWKLVGEPVEYGAEEAAA
jgi:hypothetical protein